MVQHHSHARMSLSPKTSTSDRSSIAYEVRRTLCCSDRERLLAPPTAIMTRCCIALNSLLSATSRGPSRVVSRSRDAAARGGWRRGLFHDLWFDLLLCRETSRRHFGRDRRLLSFQLNISWFKTAFISSRPCVPTVMKASRRLFHWPPVLLVHTILIPLDILIIILRKSPFPGYSLLLHSPNFQYIIHLR